MKIHTLLCACKALQIAAFLNPLQHYVYFCRNNYLCFLQLFLNGCHLFGSSKRKYLCRRWYLARSGIILIGSGINQRQRSVHRSGYTQKYALDRREFAVVIVVQADAHISISHNVQYGGNSRIYDRYVLRRPAAIPEAQSWPISSCEIYFSSLATERSLSTMHPSTVDMHPVFCLAEWIWECQ